jgi:hypothetical protein
MNKKIIGIFVVTLLISVATFIPATSSHTNPVEKRSELFNISNNDNIKQLLEQIIDKIYYNKNLSEELSELLSFPEIKQVIGEISDNETLDTIEILFSEKNIFLKILNVNQYSHSLEKKRQNHSVMEFENELDGQISSNFNHLENLSIMQELNVTSENIANWQSEWENYLDAHQKLKSIMQDFTINPVIFFVVFSIVVFFWGFSYGAASVCFPKILPMAVMITEALILGLASSYVIGSLISSDIPIVDQILTTICDMLQLNREQLIAITASLACLIVVAAYILVWDITLFVQAIGVGGMVVGPALLIALIASIEFYPGDDTN